ncbi:PAS domain-containing protein [Aurantiacibacter luteus]|uniref:PAS domain-containing protein n=1 Tax=Aurantiacibacter luteus TaxID=1581420 RepID=A0A0G9MYN0_9SPHN|nr:PAS domain-containing protein [Aurantiacibacter luteus]KLE35892.1 hypothetical protein AAW00_05910 [Aurantiacibacter luteus]
MSSEIVDDVTAGEIVRAFAEWSDRASKRPVRITRHGRPTHVLMGIDRFEAMTTPIDADEDQGEFSLRGLANYISEGVFVLDAEERIMFANSFARAFCNMHDTANGCRLTEALPSLEHSVAIGQVRRTIATRIPAQADLPSTMAPGRWLNFQTFPLRNYTACLFRDITDEVENHRLADVKEAMLEAISLHSDVGYVRINMRGMIERTDQSMSKWMAMDAERLKGVRLVDLIATNHRAAMSQSIEKVLSGGAAHRCETVMVPNREGEVKLLCSIVPLHGAYGAEGAVLVYTRKD